MNISTDGTEKYQMLHIQQRFRTNRFTAFSLTIIMTITPMMQYIQDRILEAVHWCTLEEAREKEKVFWSYVYDEENWLMCILMKLTEYTDVRLKNWDWWTIKDDTVSFTGLPPTLPRVLTALGENRIYSRWNICYIWRDWLTTYFTKICKRKLLNEDWTDATLFDQSQDTITAIWNLLWRKDE